MQKTFYATLTNESKNLVWWGDGGRQVSLVCPFDMPPSSRLFLEIV